MKIRKILFLLIWFLCFPLYAQEIDENYLFQEAIKYLSNWFQGNEKLDDYILSKRHIYWGKNSSGTPIVVIAFPHKKKLGTAYVYFEYTEGKLVRIRQGVTMETLTEIEEKLQEGPADWLYEEG